jgi:streptomycin 6-kinase
LSAQFDFPGDLARTNIELHGEAGAEWLRSLPSLIAACARRWSLTVAPPFPNLSYNYAAPALREGGSAVVLKLGFPGDRELRTEAEALHHYAGQGAVRLLEADLEQGVMLLERLMPGTLLSTISDDEEATSIAAGVMKQLWRTAPADHIFPTVADWARGMERLREHFGGGTGPLPTNLVEKAEAHFKELIASMSEPVLLHGDLHHYNILAATRQPWLAIDPKGLVGEPEYEVGAWLRNPMPDVVSWPGLSHQLKRRIDQFAAELDFDAERLKGWGIAQAMLSACWTIEDGGDNWHSAIAIAQALDDI